MSTYDAYLGVLTTLDEHPSYGYDDDYEDDSYENENVLI